MSLEKLAKESEEAYKIRCRLTTEYGARFMPTHDIHCFDNLWQQSTEKQITVFFLDSLYSALVSSDKKVALRAFIQAKEYSSETKYRPLRYQYECALVDATHRIEGFLG